MKPRATQFSTRRCPSAFARAILAGTVAALAFSFAAAAQESTSAPAGAQKPRYQGYLAAKAKARAWFDQLEVDAVELLAHNVKGIKKLAEILGVYQNFLRHTTEPAEIAAVRARVEGLARQTERPEYHSMGTCSDKELIENSMSYFRVLWLMRELGLETTGYQRELLAAKPRLDAHMTRRGPWQRAMFAEYYDAFGLEKPAVLGNVKMQGGVIARRLPAEQYDNPQAASKGGSARPVRSPMQDRYDLTHEVFVAFNYGLARTQDRFSAEDLEYTRRVLPILAMRCINESNPDLLAEMLSCMTYLGWHNDPAYRAAVDYLLDVQNPNGTWGNYERFRPRYGRYLDQHVYLHTTMVAMRALMEVYEGNWPAAE